ncbi:S9 family peptidase [Paludisphaera rhizosphaerae]|uniref:S9 family peptidase n=1 Tax=Paludisphaera rhizosphaerae TaxID=2711216 RepID=UPI0013EDF7CD|nr:acetylxylan esterase [Paludisphaera rhizosphaerae]
MRANEPVDPRDAYGAFIRRQPKPSPPPTNASGWDEHLRKVRKGLYEALGLDHVKGCDLAPEVLGVVERDDYVIERLTFQSQPDVRVTANLYRPRRQDGPAPGVLCVHGHWPWARIDPTVQARCIGLAKLGYICLCVDAFGAGERAPIPARGTYHGGPPAGMLWAAGVPLIGLQVHDNRRAVDYLTSRAEVDPTRLAITGASGGGNQTLYAGALDDRFTAVVPVCGVGTYEAYLETACCVCEVVPGGLKFARTGDVLAMIAPRALLVVSALQDSPQFSFGEAAKSVARARSRFEALGAGDRLRHVGIDSKHDYNQPMREAMYGWLDRWLRGKGDGSPVAEPMIVTEDPETLRCYPDGPSRPKSIVSVPEFGRRQAAALLAALPPPPDHREAWEAEAATLRADLAEVLGGLPETAPRVLRTSYDPARRLATIEMEPEPGLMLRGYLSLPEPSAVDPPSVVIHASEEEVTAEAAQERGMRRTGKAGLAVATVELRALGRLKPATSRVANAADHNEAEWGVWIGRPLLGQWVYDLLQWIEVVTDVVDRLPEAASFRRAPISLQGQGVAGIAAILASPYAPGVANVTADFAPVQLAEGSPTAQKSIRMGALAPNLLRLGDIGRLASLAAPRGLEVSYDVGPDGASLWPFEILPEFAHTQAVYRLYDAEDRFSIQAPGK